MKRDIGQMEGRLFDVVVIGGGIYGACLAWEAASRGMSVALIEKNDFASGTSANSLKIIHGGLRYLQHLDFKRLRESARERTILMNIAPHLVHPLPVVLPAYGYGIQGKEMLGTALALHHLISFDCKKSKGPQNPMPCGQLLSRSEILEKIPRLHQKGLRGGILFYDGQVYNSERLILAFLKSAVERGAIIANYLEVTGFLVGSSKVKGVRGRDRFTGNTVEIHSQVVVNTSGPWVDQVIRLLMPKASRPLIPLAKAVNIITKSITATCAFGLPTSNNYRDDGVVLKRKSRMLFVAPWRNHSLIGTVYRPFEGNPNECPVSRAEVEEFLDCVNRACPSLSLSPTDVKLVHVGLLPCKERASVPEEIQLKTKYEILDHKTHGGEGLFSVIGVKYTTARLIAKEVVDKIAACYFPKASPSCSHKVPLWGGNIEQMGSFFDQSQNVMPTGISLAMFQAFLRNYGTAFREVLETYLPPRDGSFSFYSEVDLIKAQVRYAVREEMAQKLTDVVFRRTELGTVGHPGEKILEICAQEMAKQLRWPSQKVQEELQETCKQFVVAA